MNVVQGLLGGSSGAGYRAQAPQIEAPFAASDIRAQQAQSAQALAQQQAYTQALLSGQGLAGGAANLQDVYGQLGGVAAGTGPNPAQAALQQATGQNIANQAALMAGQRGTAANAGLLARQVAQQGGALQQQAAAQGATLQAQQQFNALAQMGGIGAQQAAMQQQTAQGMTGAQQAQQGLQQQMLQAQNAQNVAAQMEAQRINAQQAQKQTDILGGVLGGIGGALAGPVGALAGGAVKKLFTSGRNSNPSPGEGGLSGGGKVEPKSHYGRMLHGLAHGGHALHINPNPKLVESKKVPAMVSPGEGYLNPHQVRAVGKGKADPIQLAEKIPGKAKVKGDSPKNDTVQKTLDAGGIVLPRSVMQADEPHKAAAKFVAAIMAKDKLKGKKKAGKDEL